MRVKIRVVIVMPKHRDNIRRKSLIILPPNCWSNEASLIRQHQVKGELEYPSSPFYKGDDVAS